MTMETYTSFKELQGKTLNLYDKVIFKLKHDNKIMMLHYESSDYYLKLLRNRNYLIFTLLGITDRYTFAENIYGTDSVVQRSQDFPVCSNYEALTTITLELFKLCEATIKPNWSKKFTI